MNRIVLPMKVHAVKLEYRRQLLLSIPNGYFKSIKGRNYVLITYDPDMPNISKSHPRRLIVTTKLGRIYSEKIREYLKIKAEYDSLFIEWKSRYQSNPPYVRFPVKQFYDPHQMNNEFFRRQIAHTGKYVTDNPTMSEHGIFKSKNEQMSADLLTRLDIPFKYETSVYLQEIDETINPDYLVNFYEIDRCAYLEILGLSDKLKYSVTTATKIYGFSKQQYRPGREIIYIFLYDKYNFDEEYFIVQVLSAYDSMIPDSALVWDAGSQAI